MPVGDAGGSAAGRSQPAYPPWSIKRPRAARAEMERRWGALHAIVAAKRPMTVRQVLFQASVRSVAGKTEAEYARASERGVLLGLVERLREARLPGAAP
jgi:hypothetical protein